MTSITSSATASSIVSGDGCGVDGCLIQPSAPQPEPVIFTPELVEVSIESVTITQEDDGTHARFSGSVEEYDIAKNLDGSISVSPKIYFNQVEPVERLNLDVDYLTFDGDVRGAAVGVSKDATGMNGGITIGVGESLENIISAYSEDTAPCVLSLLVELEHHHDPLMANALAANPSISSSDLHTIVQSYIDNPNVVAVVASNRNVSLDTLRLIDRVYPDATDISQAFMHSQ